VRFGHHSVSDQCAVGCSDGWLLEEIERIQHEAYNHSERGAVPRWSDLRLTQFKYLKDVAVFGRCQQHD